MDTTPTDPIPAVETIRDRSHGKPMVSHLYWDQLARVLMARRLNEHFGFATPSHPVHAAA